MPLGPILLYGNVYLCVCVYVCVCVCDAWMCMSTQSCPTLCRLPGSSVPGIFQARILEWVAIAYSRKMGVPGGNKRKPSLQLPPCVPLAPLASSQV